MKKIIPILSIGMIKAVTALSAQEDIEQISSFGTNILAIIRSITFENIILFFKKYWVWIFLLVIILLLYRLVFKSKKFRLRHPLGKQIETAYEEKSKKKFIFDIKSLLPKFKQKKEEPKETIALNEKYINTLVKYIKESIAIGAGKKTITKRLKKGGWKESCIDMAFERYETSKGEVPQSELKKLFIDETKSDMVKIVEQSGEIELPELADVIGISLHKAKEWANELDNEGKINLEEVGNKAMLVSNALKRQRILEKVLGAPPETPDKREAEGADELYDYIMKNERVTIEKAAKHLGKPADIVEDFANYLEERGKIERVYSLGRIFLVTKEEVKKFVKDEFSVVRSNKRYNENRLIKEIKKAHKKWPETRQIRIQVEREVARKIQKTSEDFYISQVMKILEQAFRKQLKPEDRRQMLYEIRDWLKEDELVVKTKKVGSVQHYKFI